MFRANGIVESDRWTRERLSFLRGLLADPPPDLDRAAVEAEIAQLEAAQTSFLRRLFRRPTRTE